MKEEKKIREELKPYTCKNVEDIIISFLKHCCYCCLKEDLEENFIDSYFVQDRPVIHLCQNCIKDLTFEYCIKCKIYSHRTKMYQILDDYNVCANCYSI